MSDVFLARVVRLSTLIRDAIDRSDPATRPQGLKRFPIDASGEATFLVGTYLREQGCGTFKYVLGERWRTPPGSSEVKYEYHAWCSREGLIVDISADRFDDATGRVIVAESPVWHQQFRQAVVYDADLVTPDPLIGKSLGKFYTTIVAIAETLDTK